MFQTSPAWSFFGSYAKSLNQLLLFLSLPSWTQLAINFSQAITMYQCFMLVSLYLSIYDRIKVICLSLLKKKKRKRKSYMPLSLSLSLSDCPLIFSCQLDPNVCLLSEKDIYGVCASHGLSISIPWFWDFWIILETANLYPILHV